MRTNFSADQLADPGLAAAEQQLRACVHCGICTATCPTYVLLGDELDGPRGRIQLIQQMLETGATPGREVVKHIDRCLSCNACVSACPSGVNYPRLVDRAREHIVATGARPPREAWIRYLLGTVLPRRWLLRPLVRLAAVLRFAAPAMPEPLNHLMLKAAGLPRPKSVAGADRSVAPPSDGGHVALHAGCVQEVIAPHITATARRVLARAGLDAVVVEGDGCCGALNHHLGQCGVAQQHAAALVREIDARGAGRPFDAVVTTASGCGAVIRDYGFQLSEQEAARSVAQRTRDIMQVLASRPLTAGAAHRGTRVAWHAPCSLVHGMKEGAFGPALLRRLGFEVVEPETSMCCGSAGVYDMLQPRIAAELRDRKAGELEALAPDFIASGNIGCYAQLASATSIPVVHPVELVDWATGGQRPAPIG